MKGRRKQEMEVVVVWIHKGAVDAKGILHTTAMTTAASQARSMHTVIVESGQVCIDELLLSATYFPTGN
jgi:hypothetical protein